MKLNIIENTLIDDGTRASKIAIFNATSGTDNQSIKDNNGKQLSVTDYVKFEKVEEESGELLISFICEDDSTCVSNSATIMKTWDEIIGNLGVPTKEEPIIIEVFSGESKNDRTYFDIKLIG